MSKRMKAQMKVLVKKEIEFYFTVTDDSPAHEQAVKVGLKKLCLAEGLDEFETISVNIQDSDLE